MTHHSWYGSSGGGISSSQRPVPDNTHNRHLCPRWDSNPQSQQASGRRPTPCTVRPVGSAQGVIRTLIFVTSGDINYIFCASIYILFVFLYDTLMKVAEATETRLWILTNNKIYYVDVHLLVCYIVYALNVLTNAANFQQFIKPKFSQDAVFSATFDSLSSSSRSSLEIRSDSVTHKSDIAQMISGNRGDK